MFLTMEDLRFRDSVNPFFLGGPLVRKTKSNMETDKKWGDKLELGIDLVYVSPS